ncbi:NTP transferase domain-containing protein [Dokdonella sp.]|uniref:nucleotidyltransferase family protein n=1 Tax=Dokdonella sp. TaxID=2291710 RepID=UPI003527F614
MSEGGGPLYGVIVLAAGSSTRLGQSKQLLLIDGESLVHRAVRFGMETGPADCVVICGAKPDQIEQVVADLDCRCLPCPDHERGMSASLRLGLQALDPSCSAALVVLTDQPALDARHLCKLRDRWRARPEQAVASGYAGTIGVPAMIPRSWFAAIQSEHGDRGARELLRTRSDEVAVITAEQLAQDIDEPEDLSRLDPG